MTVSEIKETLTSAGVDLDSKIADVKINDKQIEEALAKLQPDTPEENRNALVSQIGAMKTNPIFSRLTFNQVLRLLQKQDVLKP